MSRMADLKTRAHQLLELHHAGTTLVLPTVWDAWSARAVVAAGFPALTIGSHPLADSRGQSDNEGMTLDDALDGLIAEVRSLGPRPLLPDLPLEILGPMIPETWLPDVWRTAGRKVG